MDLLQPESTVYNIEQSMETSSKQKFKKYFLKNHNIFK